MYIFFNVVLLLVLSWCISGCIKREKTEEKMKKTKEHGKHKIQHKSCSSPYSASTSRASSKVLSKKPRQHASLKGQSADWNKLEKMEAVSMEKALPKEQKMNTKEQMIAMGKKVNQEAYPTMSDIRSDWGTADDDKKLPLKEEKKETSSSHISSKIINDEKKIDEKMKDEKCKKKMREQQNTTGNQVKRETKNKMADTKKRVDDDKGDFAIGQKGKTCVATSKKDGLEINENADSSEKGKYKAGRGFSSEAMVEIENVDMEKISEAKSKGVVKEESEAQDKNIGPGRMKSGIDNAPPAHNKSDYPETTLHKKAVTNEAEKSQKYDSVHIDTDSWHEK